MTGMAFAPQSFILDTEVNGTLSGWCALFCKNSLAVGGAPGKLGQPRCDSARVSPIEGGGDGNVTLLLTGAALDPVDCFSN